MKAAAKVRLVSSRPDRDARLAAAFRGFESRLCDLSCMAELTSDAVTELDGTVVIEDQLNLALFSMRHLCKMIDDAKAEWYRHWREPGGDALI